MQCWFSSKDAWVVCSSTYADNMVNTGKVGHLDFCITCFYIFILYSVKEIFCLYQRLLQIIEVSCFTVHRCNNEGFTFLLLYLAKVK